MLKFLLKNTLTRCLLLFSLSVLYVRCAPEKDNTSAVGLWYGYRNDVYLELIIWPDQIHSSRGKVGNNLWVSDWLFYYSPDDLLEGALQNCELRNDSLFFSEEGFQTDTAIMNEGQIRLEIDTFELQLHRLLANDAMSYILQIDTLSWENINFRNYLEGYYHRRDSIKDIDASR